MPDRQLAEFIAEADERAESIRRGLEALRSSLGEGRARRELLAGIFREVHTLKGSAAAHGLEACSALAHEFESLLDSVRRGHVPLSAALDLFDEAAEAVAAHLLNARRGEEVAEPRALVERLRAASQPHELAPAPEDVWPGAEAALPFEVERALGGAERARLREAVAEGSRVFVVEAEFDASDFDERFRELSAGLAEAGEVLATLPGIKAGAPARVIFRVVYATREPHEALLSRLAAFGASLESGGEQASTPNQRGWEGVVGTAGAATGDAIEAAGSLPLVSVRVPLEELDELVAAAHDLFRETLCALEAAGDASACNSTREEGPAGRVRRRFSEFEQRLIGLRLIPLKSVMEVAAWAGRAAARAAGREVEFELRGSDVRVDKSLAEAVAAPLLHLARNAAAHGVEPPQERISQGKPARGRVRIEAVAEGARVNLRVVDDGCGIDVKRVGRVAVTRGLIRPGAALSEEVALRLIFAPGFSTVEEVTGAAGRGVGLEAVERTVEHAGGEVRVKTEAGRGAIFELSLPARLALVPALVVRAGRDLYCLDSRGVVAAVGAGTAPGSPARPEESTVEWRGERLPVLALSDLLGCAGVKEGESAGAGAQPFVVVRAAGRDGVALAAVAFDELRGREEVLARGLGRHAARWGGVSGATELREGGVSLVLDLPRLLAARG
jgi:two-component system, chemotaxis family, sensor kinase CheA